MRRDAAAAGSYPACLQVVWCLVWLCGLCLLPGCAVFSQPMQATSQPAPLSWLTNWVGHPEVGEPFDLVVLKPNFKRPAIMPDNLLEITVWDLYEAGKPHTFPVRVSQRKVIEVPLLGEVSVEGRTIGDLESVLADAYRTQQFLLSPRVLARSLDSPLVTVHVAGAVNRPGFVELSRDEASVYAAIVSAGGLHNNAGTHIGVARHASQRRVPSESRASPPEILEPGTTTPKTELAEVGTASLKANSLEPLAVDTLPVRHNLPTDAGAAPPLPGAPEIQWFDMTSEADRELIRQVTLAEGDTVTVKVSTPPVRITGVVSRPGSYVLPAGKTLNVWEALDLAGGVHAHDVPLNVTLVRPATETHSAQRWFLQVESIDLRHPTSPNIEPGDSVHIEPTASSKLKQVVGDLWTRPSEKSGEASVQPR
jgi:protein involved in polysaccharide export with SLBB domain